MEDGEMSEFRADIGTCDRGTFVRVVHEPTGKERFMLAADGVTFQDLISRLTQEIEQELRREENESTAQTAKPRH
jgi:hypothetical protein